MNPSPLLISDPRFHATNALLGNRRRSRRSGTVQWLGHVSDTISVSFLAKLTDFSAPLIPRQYGHHFWLLPHGMDCDSGLLASLVLTASFLSLMSSSSVFLPLLPLLLGTYLNDIHIFFYFWIPISACHCPFTQPISTIINPKPPSSVRTLH